MKDHDFDQELYDKCFEIVLSEPNIGISTFQRRFRIGYMKALDIAHWLLLTKGIDRDSKGKFVVLKSP